MCYFSRALDHPQASIDVICHELNNSKFGKIDFIVGTGISGTILLMSISLKSGIPCGIVRKRNESLHSSCDIEANVHWPSINRYVIIDDFVSSGSTVKKIIEKMVIFAPYATCEAVMLYETNPYFHRMIDTERLYMPLSDDIDEIIKFSICDKEHYADTY